ncbi:MAG: hypothetical protein IPM50_01040 [Acidobacteriota bacterium]|nr:MAG: hypothetical protein IPM50_01040 [Acidobacteriota bacterium]
MITPFPRVCTRGYILASATRTGQRGWLAGRRAVRRAFVGGDANIYTLKFAGREPTLTVWRFGVERWTTGIRALFWGSTARWKN